MTGSAGLCAALEEAQQRVGTDPNEDSDPLSLSLSNASASGPRERERRVKGGGFFDSIIDAPGDDSDTDSATGKSDISVRYYPLLCIPLF